MTRLTRDGTTEPVSRDQVIRRVWGQRKFIFPVQLTTSRIDNLTRLIHTLLYVKTIHTIYIHAYIHTRERHRIYSSSTSKYTLPSSTKKPRGLFIIVYGSKKRRERGELCYGGYRHIFGFEARRREKTGQNCLSGCVALLRLHYTRLFPDPRVLLFVLQNISGYKNAVECLLE